MLRSVRRTCAVLGFLVLLALALHFALPDMGRARDVGGIVQVTVTVLAIVAGGVFAYDKLQIFRDFEPHLTISHLITHRTIGESYVHVAVTANLINSSKVEMQILDGLFRLQHIAPFSDEEVEFILSENSRLKDIQWPTLIEERRAWNGSEFLIEPGESHQETVEFVIGRDVESVLIYTYFYNSRYTSASPSAEGWGAATVSDMPSMI